MNLKERGKLIRAELVKEARNHPSDLAKHIGRVFKISRQAVSRHIRKLIEEDRLRYEGSTRDRIYTLGNIRENFFQVQLTKDLDESKVYLENVAWVVEGLPENIEDVLFYGFTEMLNNAIDHSEGTRCKIFVEREKEDTWIAIIDDGEGIFKRIARLSSLPDERQAIIELSKGKFTTDPENHSGQGIFFTSRMFDTFFIGSYGLRFSHNSDSDYDVLDEVERASERAGTSAYLEIKNNSLRTAKEVFDEFSSEDDGYAFDKTIVPVKLARFGQEQLVSRSQAKRLLARIENFKYVMFDFDEVDEIGQAFADEIFRVYQARFPEVKLVAINTSDSINKMIARTKTPAESVNQLKLGLN